MRTANICLASTLLLLLSILSAPARAQAVNVTFVPDDPENWNVNAHWDGNGGFIPESQFNENAIIGPGKSAFVNDTPPAVGGITVQNTATLEVRSGGNLTASPNSSVTGNFNLNAGGTTSVLRGGSLSVQNITAANTSIFTIGEIGGSGTATVNVTGGSLGGRTEIIGPNVNLSSSGGLAFLPSSVLAPVITGVNHSSISVTNTAQLNGVLRPQFNGYSPVLGDSWQLVSAGAIAGDFSSINISDAPVPPRGAGYTVTKTPSTATLVYENKLILSVSRATGSATIENALGSPISFDAYTISSPSGALSGNWTSLTSQSVSGWEEADNVGPSRLTEFNPLGSSSLNVSGTLGLGTPFAPVQPSSIGQLVGEDIAFSYSVQGQGTVEGFVEYVGGRNNVVLTIDPNTGQATIQNESPYFDVAIDAYTITSADGRLQFANGQWNSLADQNLGDWEEADNVSATRVTEFNPLGQTSLPGGGTILHLGNLVDTSGAPLRAQDFTFEVSLVGGGLEGDFDSDGVVDGHDFLAWQRNQTVGSLSAWEANFGNTGAAGQGGTLQGIVSIGALPGSLRVNVTAVPEPHSFVGFIICSAILLASRARSGGGGAIGCG